MTPSGGSLRCCAGRPKLSSSVDVDVLRQTSVGLTVQSVEVTISSAVVLGVDVTASAVTFNQSPVVLTTQTTPPVLVEVSPTRTVTAVVGAQGPAGRDGAPGALATYVEGMTTAGLPAGRAVHLSAAYTPALARADAFSTAQTFGVFDGLNGHVLVQGVALCSFLSFETPVVDQAVYLALGTEELDAAGKLRATVPSAGFVAPVGRVVAVPGDFAATRKALVLVRVQSLIRRHA